MNNFTTFYIVRHGQTEWNKRKLVQGQKDIPLSEKGRNQAVKLSKELEGVTFDLVVSSDLIRAKDTAEILIKNRNLSITISKTLRERKLGSLEGLSTDKLIAYFDSIKFLTESDKLKAKIDENSESQEELINRVVNQIRKLALNNPNKTILLTSHAGIIRLLLYYFRKASYDQVHARNTVENTGYFVFDTDGKTFSVKEMKGIYIN